MSKARARCLSSWQKGSFIHKVCPSRATWAKDLGTWKCNLPWCQGLHRLDPGSLKALPSLDLTRKALKVGAIRSTWFRATCPLMNWAAFYLTPMKASSTNLTPSPYSQLPFQPRGSRYRWRALRSYMRKREPSPCRPNKPKSRGTRTHWWRNSRRWRK